MVTDAGVKTDNTEREEADGCKMDYMPDRREPRECGKFLLLATALLAVICECDNSKIIYMFIETREGHKIKKNKLYTSFCEPDFERKHRPLR